MKKLWIAIFAVIVALSFCSCGTDDGNTTKQQINLSPLGDVQLANHNVRYFSLYVCGAVQNEGYYTIQEGTTYADVVRMAGLLSQTVLPDYASDCVDGKQSVLTLFYRQDGVTRSCINVNGSYVQLRRSVDGVSSEVINLIADFLQQHGKITDKTQLQQVLGDLYQDNFYKFFVEVDDYEAD